MKRKLSILSMIARHSLGKVFWILLAVPALNGLLFWDKKGESYQPLYQILDSGEMLGVILLCFVLMTLALCAALRDKGGRLNYFLHRLEISPRAIYWNHVLYNSLCYFLLFAAEGLSLFGIAFWNSQLFPESFNHQRLMLECYMSAMVHMFFPLSDVIAWVVLGVMTLSFGVCSAAMSAINRRGKWNIAAILLLGVTALYGHMQLEIHALALDGKIITLCGCVLISLPALLSSLRREVTDDD